MSYHDKLTPLHKAPPLDWPNLPELGSGGFASVRELGPAEVLKLTCCNASNAWFKQALKGQLSWPAAFPRVHQALGPLAVDADGFKFEGWRVERLFNLDDKRGAIVARSASIRSRMAVDPKAAARAVSPEVEALDALMGVVDFCDINPDEHWAVDASAALLLASACDGELSDGFLSLRRFILTHKVKLDVASRRNIMMDCFGRLRLADPLTMRLEDVVTPAPRPLTWLTARVPVRQKGFDVTTRWVAIPFQSTERAQANLAELHRRTPSLRCLVTDEATAALHLERGKESASAFEFGKVLTDLMRNPTLTELLPLAELR